MKKIMVFGLFIGSLMAGPVLAADSQVNKDMGQLKKDYTAQVHKDLKKIDAKIARFKKDVKKGDKTAQKDLHKQIKGLEAQKAGVDKKLVELEKSTGDAWKDLRHGVDDALKDLGRSVDDAVAQFKDKNHHS